MFLVHFNCHELKLHVAPKLAGVAKPVNHHTEGWQAVQRMYKYSFTEWQGSLGWELQIPLIFDQWAFNPTLGSAMNSVEKEIDLFERLCVKMNNQPRTPIFTLDAGGRVPHDYTNDHTKLWVVTGIDWGEYVTNKDGARCRQPFTATVWEWIPDKVTQSNNRFPTRPVPKTYKIKKGDTLVKIAVYFYGDGSKWRDIAKLNHLRDPNHPKVGKVIKLPQ